MAPRAHAPTEDADPARVDTRHFFLRRLHSLTGIVPVGVFLVVHLWTNMRALYGRDAFNHAVGDIQSIPLLGAVELVGIFLPLLFHGVYGLLIAAQSRPNALRYGYTRNWLYLLQRVSGVAAFAFIALHVWQFRVQKLTGATQWQSFYDDLGRTLGPPGMFAVYFLGVTASVFHFANGLWLFGNSWGLTASPRAMRRAAVACGVTGVALWALGVNTLLHFSYRCGGVLPMPEQQVERACRGAEG